MTMPDERTRAVINTQRFLRDLLDPKKTPRVPKHIRREAYWCLRHYPFEYEMQMVAETGNVRGSGEQIFGPVLERNENTNELVKAKKPKSKK